MLAEDVKWRLQIPHSSVMHNVFIP
ncbi:hypothetical protein AZE42_14054 [Rhizopogon vesiculosus]|uniref:Uncharacterized protein n=1 Tax=Rhizopogon vesiculosus TaxID=180088 RepID=A0A1J8Q9Q5_9AGAM|nr:hypothetical protein AZE42_14054 [Rhizopogon vesiculosus]